MRTLYSQRDNKMYNNRCKDNTALNQMQAVVKHLFLL